MKQLFSMKQQSGFTLIELIVVIVILGILAATALPRFLDLSADARIGVMDGVEASMRGANVMIYGKAAAQGQLGATGTVTTQFGDIDTVFGYAATVSPDLALALDLNPAGDFTVAATTIQHTGAPTPGSCQITYTAATSATVGPGYARDNSDC